MGVLWSRSVSCDSVFVKILWVTQTICRRIDGWGMLGAVSSGSASRKAGASVFVFQQHECVCVCVCESPGRLLAAVLLRQVVCVGQWMGVCVVELHCPSA